MSTNRGRTCARCDAPITLLPVEGGTGWLDETGSERCMPMSLFHYFDRTAV